MKKIVSVLLVLLMLATVLVSCGEVKFDEYNYNLSDYIKVAEYKNLPATAPSREVTDEDVQRQVEASLAYYAKKIEVTGRAAVDGDTVNISYMGYVSGNEYDPVEIDDMEFVIGLGKFPEEFETACIGCMPGESFNITVTLPEEMVEDSEDAGQVADLTVTLNAILELEQPEYTDDFARAYLHSDSISDYEANIRETLEKQAESGFYTYVISATWNVIYNNSEVISYPEKELKEKYDFTVGKVNDYVETLDLDFAAFVSSTFGMTEDQFYEYAMEKAKNDVKNEMLIYAIARAENIKLTEEEYEKRATVYATETYEYDSLEAFEENYGKEAVERLVLSDLVMEFVADHADVTYTDGLAIEDAAE